jgi:hypothetical protein
VSGVGVVAYGVQFPDGTVVLRWDTKVRSTVHYDSIEDVTTITSHGGNTVIEWYDETPAAQGSGDTKGNIMGEGTEHLQQGQTEATTETPVSGGDTDTGAEETEANDAEAGAEETATEDAGSADTAEAEGDSAGNSDNG